MAKLSDNILLDNKSPKLSTMPQSINVSRLNLSKTNLILLNEPNSNFSKTNSVPLSNFNVDPHLIIGTIIPKSTRDYSNFKRKNKENFKDLNIPKDLETHFSSIIMK